MTIDKFLELKESLELKKYVRSLDFDKNNCCSFYGSPKKHPHEQNRVILVADPFSEPLGNVINLTSRLISIMEPPTPVIKIPKIFSPWPYRFNCFHGNCVDV